MRLAQNYAEIVPFHKISTPENWVKLQYFSQWMETPKQYVTVAYPEAFRPRYTGLGIQTRCPN